MKLALNDLQRKLFEKEEEANFHKRRQEETLKKNPNILSSQHVEDENRFLHEEKKNLEGKIMQLLQENELMKRKFDEVLQDSALMRNKDGSPRPIKIQVIICFLFPFLMKIF